MYTQFFKLRQKPFANAADLRFLYHTAAHEEALASLVYNICERRGITVVIGPSGSGKTLLSNMLVDSLHLRTDIARITDAPQNGHDLLCSLCRELGIRHRTSHTLGELIERVRRHLENRLQDGQLVVAILDEAQNLNDEVLEHLRLLSNLEKDSAKLLQIILLGQSELLESLGRNALEQFRQRIATFCRVRPLTAEQTAEYIRHRLTVAGAENLDLFTADAVEAIHEHAAGLPRIINQLADTTMLTAYGAGQQQIDRAIVESCLADVPAGHHLQSTNETGPESRDRESHPPSPLPVSERVEQSRGWIEILNHTIAGGAELAGRLRELRDESTQKADALALLLKRTTRGALQLRHIQQRADRTGERVQRIHDEITALADQLQQLGQGGQEQAHRLFSLVEQTDLRLQTIRDERMAADQSLSRYIEAGREMCRQIEQNKVHLTHVATQAENVQQELIDSTEQAQKARQDLNGTVAQAQQELATSLELLDEQRALIESQRTNWQLQSAESQAQFETIRRRAQRLAHRHRQIQLAWRNRVRRQQQIASTWLNDLHAENQTAQTRQTDLASVIQNAGEQITCMAAGVSGINDVLRQADAAQAMLGDSLQQTRNHLRELQARTEQEHQNVAQTLQAAECGNQAVQEQLNRLNEQMAKLDADHARHVEQTSQARDELSLAIEHSIAQRRRLRAQLQNVPEKLRELESVHERLTKVNTESRRSKDELLAVITASEQGRAQIEQTTEQLADELNRFQEQAGQLHDLRTKNEAAVSVAEKLQSELAETTRLAVHANEGLSLSQQNVEQAIARQLEIAGDRASTLQQTVNQAAETTKTADETIAQLAVATADLQEQLSQTAEVAEQLSELRDCLSRSRQIIPTMESLFSRATEASGISTALQLRIGEANQCADALTDLNDQLGAGRVLLERLSRVRTELGEVRQLVDEMRVLKSHLADGRDLIGQLHALNKHQGEAQATANRLEQLHTQVKELLSPASLSHWDARILETRKLLADAERQRQGMRRQLVELHEAGGRVPALIQEIGDFLNNLRQAGVEADQKNESLLTTIRQVPQQTQSLSTQIHQAQQTAVQLTQTDQSVGLTLSEASARVQDVRNQVGEMEEMLAQLNGAANRGESVGRLLSNQLEALTPTTQQLNNTLQQIRTERIAAESAAQTLGQIRNDLRTLLSVAAMRGSTVGSDRTHDVAQRCRQALQGLEEAQRADKPSSNPPPATLPSRLNEHLPA